MTSNRRTLNLSLAVFLPAIVLFAYAVRILHSIQGMGSDSWWYLLLARNVVRGVYGFVECAVVQRHFYESLYGYIIGLAAGRNEIPAHLYFTARQVSAIFGALCCLPAFWLGRRYFSTMAGLAAAGFVAVFPQLVRSSAFVLTESTFTFFDLTALCFVLASLQKRSRWLAFGAGVCWGLASLTRANGIVSVLFIGIFILFYQRRELLIAVKQTLLPIAFGWLLIYGPFAMYLSHDYGKLTITPKSAAGQISVRGTYIGQPAHAEESDLDEKEFEKNKHQYPDSLLSYYLHYPKTAIRVTLHNLRRGHFDDTLRDYDFPILLIGFISVSLLIALQTRRWTVFHGVVLYWAIGFYLFNAAFLIMLQRFYEPVYVLLAVLGGAGLAELLSILRRHHQIFATGILIATYSFTFVPILPDTRGISEAPGITKDLPPFNGPASRSLRMLTLTDRVKTSLNLGVSTCATLSSFPKSASELPAWIDAIKTEKPELVLCPLNNAATDPACDELSRQFSLVPATTVTGERRLFKFDWNH